VSFRRRIGADGRLDAHADVVLAGYQIRHLAQMAEDAAAGREPVQHRQG
jgi:hypothetical protein